MNVTIEELTTPTALAFFAGILTVAAGLVLHRVFHRISVKAMRTMQFVGGLVSCVIAVHYMPGEPSWAFSALLGIPLATMIWILSDMVKSRRLSRYGYRFPG